MPSLALLIRIDAWQGGSLVGAPLKGQRVLILDDVITAGTAIREAMDIMASAEADPVGVVISLDRQEVTGREGYNGMSAIQSVEKQFGIPVVSIVKLQNVITYLGGIKGEEATLDAVRKYRDTYGVEY